MTASEALYGFVGWLSTKHTPTVFANDQDGAKYAELVDVFCKANNLEAPREGWEKELVHPHD